MYLHCSGIRSQLDYILIMLCEHGLIVLGCFINYKKACRNACTHTHFVKKDATPPKNQIFLSHTVSVHLILASNCLQPASVAQLDVHPTGDQEVASSTLARSTTYFRGD